MKVLKIVTTLVVLTSTAHAGGTNLSTGWSNTIGHSATATYSIHDNKTKAQGIAISSQRNKNGVNARVDTYTRIDESNGVGSSETFGTFTATDRSVSVGSLSSSVGSSAGTSTTNSTGNGYITRDSSKTKGNYVAYSATGKSKKYSANIEVGSVNNKSESMNVSTFNQTTNYGSTYSSSDFNY